MPPGSLLTSVRVLDLSTGDADGIGRILADLGADVLKVEPPGGWAARGHRPQVAGVSVPFALDNAGKRCATLDPHSAADRQRLRELAGTADILVDSGKPSGAVIFGNTVAGLAAELPHLVVVHVSDFGSAGPRSTWRASDAVFYALSSALSRTGPTTGTPVLPPIGVAAATASVQAAWAVLVAYYHRLRCDAGDVIDFARFDAVAQCLDPPFGSEGQAAVGLRTTAQLWRGRPRNQQIYPIFACGDGHVRICLLSPRQWRGMRAWLGEPERFAAPEFDTIAARYAVSAELNEAIAAVFAARTRAELVAEGKRRGVPIAAVLTPTEALAADHFRETGALCDVTLGAAVTVTAPVGPLVVDGQRRGLVHAARAAGTDEPGWRSAAADLPDRPAGPPPERPFDGMRIVDLGVIVAGGELGRLFADLGAEVIKVESPDHPDGLRQAPAGKPMSRSWALTHRNELSLGLDLRHPEGATVFEKLVRAADAVFANFTPGTLTALGFSFDRLRALNPAIVLAESSAYGDRGPWSDRMGYGPLVRASTGVTTLWTSPDAAPGTFYDATTIFPDHVVARLTAVATLAVLIRRLRDGDGGHVHVSQAESAISQLAATYVTEAARAQGLPVIEDDTVHAVLPCAGDDEWCVVSLAPADRPRAAAVLGVAALPAERAALIAALGNWTVGLDKTDAATLLQDAGVPAAPMNRAVDVATDPQLVARGVYQVMDHPLLDHPMPSESGPAPFTRIPPAPLRPAPMPGEHTRDVCTRVVGLTGAEVDELVAAGAVFTYPADIPTASP